MFIRDKDVIECQIDLMAKNYVIPKEINVHFQLYSKEPWDVQFVEECDMCGRKIDEFGLCGCDTGGGD